MAEIPMLSEHEAPLSVNTTNPSDYTPTEEEKKVLKLVNKLFERAKKHRARYDGKWLDFYKMFRGKQWKEQRPSFRHTEVINMVFRAIQSEVPIMTDTRPKIEFLPQEPQDRELSQILNEICDSDWQTNNWLDVLTENIYDSHFYGASLGSVELDPESDSALPKIRFQSEDVFHCYPDPNARDVNKRSRFFIHAEPTDLEQIRREYPEKGKHVKADLLDIATSDRTELGEVRFKSPTDNKTIVEGQSGYDLGEQDKCLKITTWLIDDDYDEEEKQTQQLDGSYTSEFVQKAKYPKGRKICTAGGVVLHDGPNPYDDGLFPCARLLNYILPREFWGISEVEQLESPQRIFNKLVSFALDVLTLMGNPVWIVSNDSGIDTDNLTNRPGLVIEPNPNSTVRREEGVQLQPYVLQLIDRMEQWFNKTSGDQDISSGVKPEGITAASAIQSLQEAAQTRIRQKMKNVDSYLQNIGQLYLSRVFQFYTTPRIIRLTNNQNAQKYFKFSVETNENGEKQVRVRNYVQDNSGTFKEDLNEKIYPVKGLFDVKVSTGSSLPFAKQEKFAVAKTLYELGVIDEEALLKDADYPNWESVLSRVQEKKAREAAMQAQAPAQ
jgi:hypothetical protein